MKRTNRVAACFVAAIVLSGQTAVIEAKDTAIVEVRLTEYAIEMPQTLPPGPTTFAIRNEGQKNHSFRIEGPGLGEMAPVIVRPRKTGSLQVTLQPGDYKVYCPIGSHSAKGMTMTLAVKAK
jgi:plastocyanin